MGAIDTTIVLLALPSITQSLGANLYSTIWVILIYLLVLAVSTTQLGRLGDIYGRSKMFNLGFAIFTIGSGMCAISTDILFLIVSRALQGVGGAMLQANSGAIIADIFPRERRGKAFGYIGFGFSIGAMLGIVLGGILTTFIGWQSIFYINVPIGIVGVALGLMYIKDNKVVKEKIDLVGMFLLGAALVLITYAMIDFASLGAELTNISMAVVGLVLLACFVIWERRISYPMLDFGVFKHKILKYSISAAFFQSFGYLSVAFILILYLQGIRGLNPLDASLLLVPGYIISSFTAPYMGRLSDRFGSRIIATIGLALMCLAILIYLTLGITTSLYIVIVGSLFSGIGGAMFWPANSSSVMSHAPPDKYGSVNGLLRTVSNVGIMCSFVVALTAASLGVPRSVAFSIFLGTSKLIGGVSVSFLQGIDIAFVVSFFILVIAAFLSYARGKEDRASHIHAPPH